MTMFLMAAWAAAAADPAALAGDSDPEGIDFAPNQTLREQILVFGPDPEAAERAAMIKFEYLEMK